jgi:glycerate 2-kinase
LGRSQNLRAQREWRQTTAARRGVPVVAVAGLASLTEAEIAAAGFAAAYSLADLEPDHAASTTNAADLLAKIGHQIARAPIPNP